MLKHLQERVALRAVAVASFSAAMCSSGVAAADLDSRMKWLSAGANFGVSNQAGRTDWIAGGEVSVGAIKELLWAGAYLDAVYDSGADRVRLSVGPEVGFLLLGVDGGFMVETGERGSSYGVVVRPMIALIYVFPRPLRVAGG